MLRSLLFAVALASLSDCKKVCAIVGHIVVNLDLSGSQKCSVERDSIGDDAKGVYKENYTTQLKWCDDNGYQPGQIEKFIDSLISHAYFFNDSGRVFFGIVGYGMDTRLEAAKGKKAVILLPFGSFSSVEEAKKKYRDGLRKYMFDGYGPMYRGFREVIKMFDEEMEVERKIVITLSDGKPTMPGSTKRTLAATMEEVERLRKMDATLLSIYTGGTDKDGYKYYHQFASSPELAYDMSTYDETKMKKTLSQIKDFLKPVCFNGTGDVDAQTQRLGRGEPLNVPLVVGVAFAAIVIALVIAAVIFTCERKRRQKLKNKSVVAKQVASHRDHGVQSEVREGLSLRLASSNEAAEQGSPAKQ